MAPYHHLLRGLQIGNESKVGPWRLGKILGKGSSGYVRLARHHTTGKLAAVKVIRKDTKQNTTASIQEAGYDIPEAIQREALIMSLLKHPNITQIYGIWENESSIYLVLEYAPGGDLLRYMAKKQIFTEEEIACHLSQILAGLSYMHHLGIYHRDLKHENLMVDNRGNIKIADFGMAAMQPENALFRSPCGSPSYAAPEILQNQPYNGSEADVWSLGVIVFGLLANRLPFESSAGTAAIAALVVRAEYKMPETFSAEASSLLSRMLEIDPKKRISLIEIENHPFYQKALEKSKPGPDLSYLLLANAKLNVSHQPNLDVDSIILAKLQLLCKEQGEGSIVSNVLARGQSREKTLYQLLVDGNLRSGNIDQSSITPLLHPRPHALSIDGGVRAVSPRSNPSSPRILDFPILVSTLSEKEKIGRLAGRPERIPRQRYATKLSELNVRQTYRNNELSHILRRTSAQVSALRTKDLGAPREARSYKNPRDQNVFARITLIKDALGFKSETRRSELRTEKACNSVALPMVDEHTIIPKGHRLPKRLKKPSSTSLRSSHLPATNRNRQRSGRIQIQAGKENARNNTSHLSLDQAQVEEPGLTASMDKIAPKHISWSLKPRPNRPSPDKVRNGFPSVGGLVSWFMPTRQNTFQSSSEQKNIDPQITDPLYCSPAEMRRIARQGTHKSDYLESVVLLTGDLQKFKERLTTILHSWQSYGAGRIRIASNGDIVWRTATTQSINKKRTVLSIRMLALREEPAGIKMTFSMKHGTSEKLNIALSEIMSLLNSKTTTEGRQSA